MTHAEICKAVEALGRKYAERDPFRLCEALGIHLLFQPLSKDPDAVKGFFLESKRIRTITVNSDLPEILQRIIVAHELCHALFHRKSGIHTFHEFTLFDQNSLLEKEANLFASELLLSDDQVFDALNQDTTFFAAAALNVPNQLLDFKFRLMKWKGYKLTTPHHRPKQLFAGCDGSGGNRVSVISGAGESAPPHLIQRHTPKPFSEYRIAQIPHLSPAPILISRWFCDILNQVYFVKIWRNMPIKL